MRLVGFGFKKISVEKKKDSTEDLKIGTRIDISGIEEIASDLIRKEESVVKVGFEYSVDYQPDIAKVELSGTVLLAFDKKEASEIVSNWKNKKMSEDFRITMFNFILRKSNIKALELEEQMNLPLHVPMPSVKKQKKE